MRALVERGESDWGSTERALRAPDPRLRALLSRGYLGLEHRSVRFGSWLEPPPASLTLMISLGEPLRSNGGTLPRAWIAGLDDRPELVQSGPSQSLIDVKLTPVGAFGLCGLPLRELRGEVVALQELFGERGGRLTERLDSAVGWDERFDRLESFLLERAADAPQAHPIVARACSRLHRSAGRLPIGELVDDLGCSRRHLSATFHEQIGLPPKSFARLIRFEEVRRRLRDAPARWADIAYDCGYSDQSHLNRDFRELAGVTPSDFLARQMPSGGTVGDGVTFLQDNPSEGA